MAKGSNLFQNAYRKGTRQVLRLGTLWHAVAALQTILVCGLAVMKLSFTGTLKHDTPATIGYITLIRGYCIEVYRSIYIYACFPRTEGYGILSAKEQQLVSVGPR